MYILSTKSDVLSKALSNVRVAGKKKRAGQISGDVGRRQNGEK